MNILCTVTSHVDWDGQCTGQCTGSDLTIVCTAISYVDWDGQCSDV